MSQRGEKNVPFDGILRAPPSPPAALALTSRKPGGPPNPKEREDNAGGPVASRGVTRPLDGSSARHVRSLADDN